MVTLRDGTTISGFLGSASFISSDPKERDIYIEQVWRVDDDDKWTPHAKWGVWIPHSEIRYIELMPFEERPES